MLAYHLLHYITSRWNTASLCFCHHNKIKYKNPDFLMTNLTWYCISGYVIFSTATMWSCSAKELAAQHPDSGSSSEEEEFTLLRADSIQTSDTEESDELLIPDGSTAVKMRDMSNGRWTASKQVHQICR